MALRLSDKWLWDFWLAQDGPDYHIFYLQAPRSLKDEALRHWHVSIGHAVSQDLQTWRILLDALCPGKAAEWDDYTTWTGSIIRHSGLWYFFYTGACRAENGLIQRIGLATSSDSIHWRKHPANPLLTLDARWYEQLDLNVWHDQAWRDPWVFQHPDTGNFHALITARCNSGPSDGRGAIGHARSHDLLHWEVLPPLVAPGDFGHMEVPQIVHIGQRYYLLFSTPGTFHSAQYVKRTRQNPRHGTLYMIGETPLGPFRFLPEEYLVADGVGSLYSSKLVKGPDDAWYLLACRQFAQDGSFIGELTDSFPLCVERDGSLSVEWEHES